VQFNKKFRRRFRMTYEQFQTTLVKVKRSYLFDRWVTGRDATGKPSSPIELMVLGAMRHLGRGLTFDDLEECTAIHEETHRQFLHVCIEWGSNVFYDEQVQMPRSQAECHTHRNEFDMGGLTGAGFSTDATNVIMWKCSHNLKQMNSGFKQTQLARSHNTSVNHRQKILWSARGHPSRWNDKTLAHHDEFLVSL